jgi:hypothetical protein
MAVCVGGENRYRAAIRGTDGAGPFAGSAPSRAPRLSVISSNVTDVTVVQHDHIPKGPLQIVAKKSHDALLPEVELQPASAAGR